MPYSAKAIANYFIDRALIEEKPLSPMKVQKLVYYSHGWHIAIQGKPLINEQVEAWKFGPVIRTLYAELAAYGNRNISAKIASYEIERSATGGIIVKPRTPEIGNSTEEDHFARELMGKVWDTYGRYTAVQLSNLTHAPGTPWDQVNKKYDELLPKGTDIPTESIREYFVNQAK